MSSETRGVKVAATKEGITITSDNPDLGEVREELEAEYNAEPLAIGFNPKYMVELLMQMTSDQITIALGGEHDPGLVRPLTSPRKRQPLGSPSPPNTLDGATVRETIERRHDGLLAGTCLGADGTSRTEIGGPPRL